MEPLLLDQSILLNSNHQPLLSVNSLHVFLLCSCIICSQTYPLTQSHVLLSHLPFHSQFFTCTCSFVNITFNGFVYMSNMNSLAFLFFLGKEIEGWHVINTTM